MHQAPSLFICALKELVINQIIYREDSCWTGHEPIPLTLGRTFYEQRTKLI
jgi:hypothetical protein